jgi:AmmeMemoRadiSam system protein B
MEEGTRPASHAGSWYTDNTNALNRELTTNLSNAERTKPFAKAVIGPHAGYRFSGPTAAWAYIHINPDQFTKVFLLGPSHRISFEGCALPATTSYSTPVGDLPIDTNIVNQLQQTGKF